MTTVLQPEKGSCDKATVGVCQLPLNVGCLVGLSCDVTGVDGSSPPAAAAGAKNGRRRPQAGQVSKRENERLFVLRKNTGEILSSEALAPASYWPTNAVTNRAEKSWNQRNLVLSAHKTSKAGRVLLCI